MANPDFAAWMQSFGGHGERVERTEQFGPALERALASDGPALIHVLIPDTIMPPASSDVAASSVSDAAAARA